MSRTRRRLEEPSGHGDPAWLHSRGKLGRDFSANRAHCGAIAQLGERLNGIQEVGGSTPPGSTSLRPPSGGYGWQASLRNGNIAREKKGAKAARRSPKGEDGRSKSRTCWQASLRNRNIAREHEGARRLSVVARRAKTGAALK